MEIEILNHGIEHSQYFQGCGTSFTRWQHVATGVGDTLIDALEDALEMALSGVGAVEDDKELVRLVRESPECAEWSQDTGSAHDDCVGSDQRDHAECELHYFVSIRWRK